MAKKARSALQDATQIPAKPEQVVVTNIPLRDGQWMSVKDTAFYAGTTPEEIMRQFNETRATFPAEFTCVLFDPSSPDGMSRYFNLLGALCFHVMAHPEEHADVLAEVAEERRPSRSARRRRYDA